MPNCLTKYTNPVEAVLAKRLLDKALKRGWRVSVYDGEEWTVKQSADRQTILDALATTEADTLLFRDADGQKIGRVWLIWGNGEDLISDSSDVPALNELIDEVTGG